jgi:putative transposase
MPRGARLDAPGTLHHVIIRGIERCSIVHDEKDGKMFTDRMGMLAKESGTSIYAYALMTNHAHILLKSGPNGLATYMRRLLTGYAQYFNRRHKRAGHLFQNRYKSIICEEESYFDKLVAYIHLNPLRAGLVGTLEELASYPWCGHGVLMKKIRCDWMDDAYVLQFFGSRESAARKAYYEYLEEEMGIDRENELSGGGLIRSQGGWAKVQSMRRHEDKALGDERILGGGDFVREVLKEAEGRKDVVMPETDRMAKFNDAIEQACDAAGVTVVFLQSGSRSGVLPGLRKQLAMKAVKEYGISLAETARQLGVTANAVSYMLKSQ